jgi:hypothetical protein
MGRKKGGGEGCGSEGSVGKIGGGEGDTHRTVTVNAVNALEISEIRHILRGSYPRWGTGPQNVSLLKQFTTVFE